MMRRWMLIMLALALIACGAACGGKDDNAGAKKDDDAAPAKDDNKPGVTLTSARQTLAGIKTDELKLRPVADETVAYGKLEEDPATLYVVRAPYAGMLRATAWPSQGQTVAEGAVLATVEPRLQLIDRVTLNTQFAAAKAELNAALEAQKLARSAWNRATALNADNKNVSDRAVEEAAAKLGAEKARAEGAKSLADALQSSLTQAGTTDARPVKAERAGAVLQILAQPGENVEQGEPLLRLIQQGLLLARIEIPIGDKLPGSGPVRVMPAGHEAQPAIPADALPVSPIANPATQGVSLLYRLQRSGPGVRHGAAVTAWLPGTGAGGKSLVIPRAAVVQQDGRAWAYVRTAGERFERRPVSLDQPVANGYTVSHGFAPGDRVVITGAQSLLSEEFKSANEVD